MAELTMEALTKIAYGDLAGAREEMNSLVEREEIAEQVVFGHFFSNVGDDDWPDNPMQFLNEACQNKAGKSCYVALDADEKCMVPYTLYEDLSVEVLQDEVKSLKDSVMLAFKEVFEKEQKHEAEREASPPEPGLDDADSPGLDDADSEKIELLAQYSGYVRQWMDEHGKGALDGGQGPVLLDEFNEIEYQELLAREGTPWASPAEVNELMNEVMNNIEENGFYDIDSLLKRYNSYISDAEDLGASRDNPSFLPMTVLEFVKAERKMQEDIYDLEKKFFPYSNSKTFVNFVRPEMCGETLVVEVSVHKDGTNEPEPSSYVTLDFSDIAEKGTTVDDMLDCQQPTENDTPILELIHPMMDELYKKGNPIERSRDMLAIEKGVNEGKRLAKAIKEAQAHARHGAGDKHYWKGIENDFNALHPAKRDTLSR